MTADVNFLIFPDGKRLVRNPDTAAAKVEALRLGLLPGIMAELRRRSGTRGAAGIARDGDRLVAVIAWEGFKHASDNGWITLTVTPACQKTANWLMAVARTLIDATGPARLEGGSPWRN